MRLTLNLIVFARTKCDAAFDLDGHPSDRARILHAVPIASKLQEATLDLDITPNGQRILRESRDMEYLAEVSHSLSAFEHPFARRS